MRRLCRTLLPVTLIFVGVFHTLAPTWAQEAPVTCGNERYEDFMRLQYEHEKHDVERQKYADDIKKVRAGDRKAMDEARRTFKRDKKPDDAAAEKLWLESRKDEKEKNELLRRRYVQMRDEKASTHCQSLKIPELKEFDLEGY